MPDDQKMDFLTATPVKITEVVLRDAHQSLFATRLRLEDMLPIAAELDAIGYGAIESWGGATFDACIRFLGEDPWERIRQLKAAMPNTPQQMLLRGQNLLGYRHYADDVVCKFVERAAVNGVDVFRIFDAMNDVRNLKTAVAAVLEHPGKAAQGTLSYTVSPVHTHQMWVDMAKQIEDLGAHSIAIKDMAGLLTPYVAYDLVCAIKQAVKIPVHLHCHATTGLSTMTLLKAIEAGVDSVDTAISSMSMTYGHSPTETVVAALQGTPRDPGLDLKQLESISLYFKKVRQKYAAFEGSLKGIDARILVAQVPGGMLTNMENQLKEQGALEKFDDVLEEIPKVREDLGYIPLVTPTSQIVGTQAVLNVLTGERYKTISKETMGILKGEYGAAPAPFNEVLQKRVLGEDSAITVRPADLLKHELTQLTDALREKATTQGITLSASEIDDVLIYALFSQVGLKYLKYRHNPEKFESKPAICGSEAQRSDAVAPPPSVQSGEVYTYTVDVAGDRFVVNIQEGESEGMHLGPQAQVSDPIPRRSVDSAAVSVTAPLAGNVFKVPVKKGQQIAEGEVVMVLEAMKMETEVRAASGGTIAEISVSEGDAVALGDPLVRIA